MSSADLAREAEISKPFLSLVESGRRQASLTVLRRIAAALQIPSETLVLLAMAEGESSLSSTDDRATSLAESIKQMANMEDNIRRQMRAPLHETQRTDD